MTIFDVLWYQNHKYVLQKCIHFCFIFGISEIITAMAGAYFLAAAEEQRLNKRLRIERRLLRGESVPLNLPNNEFVAHFRLSKTQFLTLCADVIPLLPHPRRSTAVCPEIKVCSVNLYNYCLLVYKLSGLVPNNNYRSTISP